MRADRQIGRAYGLVVRHATEAALDELEPLLTRMRLLPGLVERTRGVFYRKARAFLHFHEDPAGLFADMRTGDDFERFRVQEPDERETLLRLAQEITGDP